VILRNNGTSVSDDPGQLSWIAMAVRAFRPIQSLSTGDHPMRFACPSGCGLDFTCNWIQVLRAAHWRPKMILRSRNRPHSDARSMFYLPPSLIDTTDEIVSGSMNGVRRSSGKESSRHALRRAFQPNSR
jgi:hypothetical protein